MNNLYELAEAYANISHDIEAELIPEEAIADTLEGLEGAIEIKAENIGVWCKNLKAEAAAIKAEEEALKARRVTKENREKVLKNYLLACLKRADIKKIDTPRAAVSIRSNPPSVSIEDESAFIDMCEERGMTEYLKYAAPEIRKAEIKAALTAGKEVPFAEMRTTERVEVK